MKIHQKMLSDATRRGNARLAQRGPRWAFGLWPTKWAGSRNFGPSVMPDLLSLAPLSAAARRERLRSDRLGTATGFSVLCFTVDPRRIEPSPSCRCLIGGCRRPFLRKDLVLALPKMSQTDSIGSARARPWVGHGSPWDTFPRLLQGSHLFQPLMTRTLDRDKPTHPPAGPATWRPGGVAVTRCQLRLSLAIRLPY